MDESERLSPGEEARRQAAENARHERAHANAAPLWGFGATPLAGGIIGVFMNLSKPDCYTSFRDAFGVLHSARRTDIWCLVATSSDQDGWTAVLGVLGGAALYGVVYGVSYAYHYFNS